MKPKEIPRHATLDLGPDASMTSKTAEARDGGRV